MPKADSTAVLRMSLKKPTRGQAEAKVTAKTPLPDGWTYFCSSPDRYNRAHWYATAPWDAPAINRERKLKPNDGLMATVDAPTWAKLHAAVNAQVTLYDSLMGASK